MDGNIVDVTIAEAREKPDRRRVLERLRDWQTRVHSLYESVQNTLGPGYACDRTGKHESMEEMVQRAGLTPGEVPKLDILTITQNGKQVARFEPRSLWMIGANGQVNVVLTPKSGGRRLYMLIDRSLPLSNDSDWRIVQPSDRLHQPPFRPETFGDLLE